MLILRGLRCTKIVLIRPRSSKGDSTVGQEGCRQMPQKEKRESSSPFVGKVFSKFNCTKGITKVKENSGGAYSVSGHRVFQDLADIRAGWIQESVTNAPVVSLLECDRFYR